MTQQEALAIMHSGRSVLLTGAAGSGKTYTLSLFIAYARSLGKYVSVTASTGLAATHLNGTTIHSWSGIGIHDTLARNYSEKLSKQRSDIITKTDILIIDEISMIHDFRLDIINEACQKVRQSQKPFGGLQVILCGDLFQLPPVNREGNRQGNFFTESEAWQNSDFAVCYLHEQHRQKNDESYTAILNGIRKGKLSPRQIHVLQSRQNSVIPPASTITKLLTTNSDVDYINSMQLHTINEPLHTYPMVVSGAKKYTEQLRTSCLAQDTVELKQGARVMCIKNSSDKKYVNGSLGVVIDFDKETSYPYVRLHNNTTVLIKPDTWELIDGEKVRASIVQLPLRLAWAITVHKSQGMTLDGAYIDLRNAFIEGMGYVALSRIKDIESLYLAGLNSMALRVNQYAKNIDAILQQKSDESRKQHIKDIEQWAQNAKKQPKHIITPRHKTSWNDKLAKMREQYPNAYMPWSEEDDKKLVIHFSDGYTITRLSTLLGRHAGSIKVRLQKHLGDDIFEEA